MSAPEPSLIQRIWLRAAVREVEEGWDKRACRDEEIGPVHLLKPWQQHLLREHWTPREREMLLDLCNETPFAELCRGVDDLVPARIAVGFLAFRKLIAPNPSGEPLLTARGLNAGDRFNDEAVFEAAGA